MGEEEIEGTRHLWVESHISFPIEHTLSPTVQEDYILKMLIPEDQIVSSNIAEHAVRVWTASNGGEARLVNLQPQTLQDEPVYGMVFISFPWTQTTDVHQQERTLTIGGNEVILTHNEAGEMPMRQIGDCNFSGNTTWWPSENHGFGIAAAEVTMRMQDDISKYEIEWQMSLIATGTDADSALPDDN